MEKQKVFGMNKKKLKVLWFTNTPSLYDQDKHHYHGGGWIESLEQLIHDEVNIDLAISFFHSTESLSARKNNCTYYPIKRKSVKKNPFSSLFNNWSGSLNDDNYLNKILSIIDDFSPDIIHIFGTEGPFAEIQEHISIPVVIHIQGLLGPYTQTYFPINQNSISFVLNLDYFIDNILGSTPTFGFKRFRKQAEREKIYLTSAKNVMGRTQWDKMIAKMHNPNVKYYHVDEVLRLNFYESPKFLKNLTKKDEFTIISTLSATTYKGIDVVLKTAKIFKDLYQKEFTWQIVGIESNNKLFKHFEKTEKIKHEKINVVCLGRKNPSELYNLLNSSDVFVHPSYIDNSPNSVCEAQMIGLPVIASNVGGISSLISHEEDGILVPSNGIYEIANNLFELSNNIEKRKSLGEAARQTALLRHDRKRIVENLLNVYYCESKNSYLQNDSLYL